MPFTDEDLKRLKKDCTNGVNDNGDEVDSFSLHLDFILALIARLERSEAERDAWKARCEAAENCIGHEPRRAKFIHAPEDPEVLELCERIGFGAVMDSAARQWQQRDPIGAHTVGSCAVFFDEWEKLEGK